MKFSVGLLLPVLAAAVPLELMDEAVAPSADITIVSASTSGSGCPSGTVSTDLSPDKTVITFGFDAFQTFIGPEFSIRDRSKNCQLHLNLQYPGGFTFSVVESTYHGFAYLEEGVTGSFYSTYYFSQDAGKTTTTKTSIEGGGEWALGQVYTKSDKVPTTGLIWAPCGASGILNINNRIGLSSTNKTSEGMLTDDDATVAFTQQLHLTWAECA